MSYTRHGYFKPSSPGHIPPGSSASGRYSVCCVCMSVVNPRYRVWFLLTKTGKISNLKVMSQFRGK